MITFEDSAVEAICLANFDYNSNGYISKAEAASVTSLGTVFQNNTEITSFDELKYFTGITSINGGWDAGAFYGCSNLQSVELPDSITHIDNDAFMNCEKLSIEVNLPNLNQIGYGAFQSTAITRIVNLGSITTIPNAGSSGSHRTFGNCPSLEYAILPDTITYIGSSAFCGCSNLKTIVIQAVVPPTFGIYAFSETHPELLFYVPDNVVDAYKSAWTEYTDRIKPLSKYTE